MALATRQELKIQPQKVPNLESPVNSNFGPSTGRYTAPYIRASGTVKPFTPSIHGGGVQPYANQRTPLFLFRLGWHGLNSTGPVRRTGVKRPALFTRVTVNSMCHPSRQRLTAYVHFPAHPLPSTMTESNVRFAWTLLQQISVTQNLKQIGRAHV